MRSSSIESAFRFLSYKIDHLKMDMQKADKPLSRDWNLRLGIRQPTFSSRSQVYTGGIDCGIFSFQEDVPGEKKEGNTPTASIELGIIGRFAVEKDRLPPELEQQLVRVQIPALLFPYARATVTFLLANAGFGSVILPLLNMNEIAKDILRDKEVAVTDD